MRDESTVQRETLFGHPVGLYTLFFAEMWERFSYYGMRALLNLYMLKGFLGYNDEKSYEVYSAYIALVYATGFIGGMFADRLLGTRRSVVLGGLMMAAGHLMMTVRKYECLLCCARAIDRRQRFLQAKHFYNGRNALPARQSKEGQRLHDFLHRHQPGRSDRALICGYVGDHIRLALRLRTGNDRHADRPRGIRSADSGHPSADLVWSSSYGDQHAVYDEQYLPICGQRFFRIGVSNCGHYRFCRARPGRAAPLRAAPPDPSLLKRMMGPIRLDVLVYLGAILSVPFFALLLQHNQIATSRYFTVLASSRSSICCSKRSGDRKSNANACSSSSC